jgi:hypothetical protein
VTRISDQLPDDIIYLIRNISEGNITDAEMEGILPDFYVRVAVVDEGKNLPVSPETHDKAAAWIEKQRGFQKRASEAWAVLQRAEPIDAVAVGKGGNLPEWFGYTWTSNLMFDWATNLHLAVFDAEKYISERGLR